MQLLHKIKCGPFQHAFHKGQQNTAKSTAWLHCSVHSTIKQCFLGLLQYYVLQKVSDLAFNSKLK